MADSITYTVTSEVRRWDLIALLMYGDSYRYSDRLIAANPQYAYDAVLPSGAVLTVPVVDESEVSDTVSDELLAPWKRI